MKNIKISIRLTLILVFCVVCMVGLGLCSIGAMNELNDSNENLAKSWLPSATSTSNVDTYIARYRANEYKHVISEDKKEMEEIESELSRYHDETDAEIKKLYQYEVNQNNIVAVEKVDQLWEAYVKESEKAMALSKANKTDEAMEILLGDSYKSFVSVSDAISSLEKFNEEGVESANSKSEATYSSISITIIIIVFVILILLIVVGSIFIKSIVAPVKTLNEVTESIINGNFDNEINYDGKDEIGTLAKNFKVMVNRLREYVKYINEVTSVINGVTEGNLCFELEHNYEGEFNKIKIALESLSEILNRTMGNINQSATQVADGSAQVSDSAQALAQGSTEQASSVEQLVLTIGTISDNVTVNAENAKSARELAYSFGETIKESNVRMEKMIDSMAEITETSGEISKIIKLIDDIAFQTNILSLNAAVEAARAGAAGKGFAVVADEVRNLATKSAEAAKNTSSLIKNSIKAVNNGTKIADDTASMLNSVVDETGKLIETMNSIADSSESQSDAVSKIKEGIEQISNVVQTNSATAEQSASISEELSGQAEVLKGLVGKFKLRNNGEIYTNPIEKNIKLNSFNKTFETRNSNVFEKKTPVPLEIVLNENAKDAYVPEINLVKNDLGSDKY